MKKCAEGYSGYPVSRPMERKDPSVSQPDQTEEQQQAAESHNHYALGPGRINRDWLEERRNLVKKKRHQRQVERQVQGRADPLSTSRLVHPGQVNPGGDNARSLDNLTMGGASDKMSMVHTAASALRAVARKHKKLDKGQQGEEDYLEGGRLLSNEETKLDPTPVQSRHQGMR
jgi:hypothetical protein